MLNLLRMNFYRLVKTKGMWVVLICMSLLVVFSTYMEKVDLKLTERSFADGFNEMAGGLEGASAVEEYVIDNQIDEEDEIIVGIGVQTPNPRQGKFPRFLEFYNADLASGIILIFVTIASVIFVNGEEKFGFIKNIAGQTRHKSMIYLAKVAVLACYNIVLFVFYGLLKYVACSVFFHERGMKFGTEYFKETIILLGVNVLLYAAFSSGLAFVTTVFRSTTIGITLGILSAIGMGLLIFTKLEKMLGVELLKYLVVFNSGKMALGASSETICFAAATGMVWLVLYNALGAIWFSRRDVA